MDVRQRLRIDNVSVDELRMGLGPVIPEGADLTYATVLGDRLSLEFRSSLDCTVDTVTRTCMCFPATEAPDGA